MEKVILVNKNDEQIGIGEKLKVHQEGKLHRCFSILIFNSKGELLIQQRVKSKYHSPGLWSNTCCSHPRPGEDLREAVKRRLKEEMGIKASNLKEFATFIYKAKLGNLIEHELDHVFVGKFDGQPKPNKNEVQDFKWINFQELKRDIKKYPRKYTFWFKRIFELYGEKFKNLF